MKKLFLAIIIFAVALVAWAAGVDEHSPRVKYRGGKSYMYRVSLTDKRHSPFTLADAGAYLSPKAIERRQRQHLAVDSTDLPVSQIYVDSIEKCGCRVVSRSKWNNTVVANLTDTMIVGRIRQLPFVSSAKLVWISPDSVDAPAPRPHYHKQLELHDTTNIRSHGVATDQLEMVGGIRLHDSGFRGKGMTIAVMDAGFLNADMIPALTDINLIGYADFVYPRSRDIFAEMEHGEQVLSIMATNQPGVYVGSAPEAAYWILRCEEEQTEQPAEEDWWAAAAEFADSVGVDVINSSLGFHNFDEPFGDCHYWQQDGKSTLISRTASMLASKGIVLVNSCGNDGMSAWKKINFPADADNILSVGAVTSERCNAGFSSLGPSADGRVKPDVMAQGSPAAVVTERGTLSSSVGTSFASPIVAGMVACLWQKYPEKTATEIINMVRQSADNAQHPDNVYGYGVPDFSKCH